MSATDNLQLVKTAFAYFSKQDIPSLLSLFSVDAVWIEPGTNDCIPYAGVFTGHEGIMQLLGIIGYSIKIKSFEPNSFVADESRVVVTGINEAEVLVTGKSYCTDWAYIFTIQDGKFARLQVFMDTLAVSEAFKAAPDQQKDS